MEDNRHRPATSAPYPPGREDIEDTRHRPAMSTPYPPGRERQESLSTCRMTDVHAPASMVSTSPVGSCRSSAGLWGYPTRHSSANASANVSASSW